MPSFNKNSRYWYGLRHGSNDPKASGYFGELPINGGMATEYSADVEMDGKNVQIPTITPNLDPDALMRLLAGIRSNQPIPDDILDKAMQHARVRGLLGKSPFWAMPEKQYNPSGGLLGGGQTIDAALLQLLYGK